VIAVLEGMVKEGTLDEAWTGRSIEVLNKADLMGGVDAVPLRPNCIAVSAVTGEGIDALKAEIDRRVSTGMEVAQYDLPHGDGQRLAWLYQHGEVVARDDGEETVHITVRLRPEDRARFERLDR
jgi:GTP-binding protein HflX